MNSVSYLTVQFAMRLTPGLQDVGRWAGRYFYQPDTRRWTSAIHAPTGAGRTLSGRYGFKNWPQLLRAVAAAILRTIKRLPDLLPAETEFSPKGKQRLPVRNPAPLATPQALKPELVHRFMHDALVCGRRFRTLNAVGWFNRGSTGDRNRPEYPGLWVIRVLTDRQTVATRWKVAEWTTGQRLVCWRWHNGPKNMAYSSPYRRCKPTQNAYRTVQPEHTGTEIPDFTCSEHWMEASSWKLMSAGWWNITNERASWTWISLTP